MGGCSTDGVVDWKQTYIQHCAKTLHLLSSTKWRNQRVNQYRYSAEEPKIFALFVCEARKFCITKRLCVELSPVLILGKQRQQMEVSTHATKHRTPTQTRILLLQATVENRNEC